MANNERLLILNLLRDGKISADEAERLLRAIGRTKHEREPSGPGEEVERFFRRVAEELRRLDLSDWKKRIESALEDFRKTFSEMAWDVPPKTEEAKSEYIIEGEGSFDVANLTSARIRQKGGGVRLERAEGERLEIRAPQCHVHFDEEGGASIEGIGGELLVAIPDRVRRVHIEGTGGNATVTGIRLDAVTVRLVGGSLRVEDVAATLTLGVVGGGLHLARVESGAIDAETDGGGIFARLGDIREGTYRFAASGGGVTVELGPLSDFEVTYSVTAGMFDSQWEGESVGENQVRVGAGGATLELAANGGSIALWRSA